MARAVNCWWSQLTLNVVTCDEMRSGPIFALFWMIVSMAMNCGN